jgi:hypothetical protein
VDYVLFLLKQCSLANGVAESSEFSFRLCTISQYQNMLVCRLGSNSGVRTPDSLSLNAGTDLTDSDFLSECCELLCYKHGCCRVRVVREVP